MAVNGKCADRERHVADVITAMEKLIDVVLEQKRALQDSGSEARALTKDFAKAVGEKERALASLYAHEREHGCAQRRHSSGSLP